MRKLFLNVLLILACHISGLGQGFYIDGAIVSVSSMGILTIPDSLVNRGTLINNGTLNISGAWINQGIYAPGSGLIDFKSDLTQTINHNAQSFERLVISGLGEKQFLADITIESELNLQSSVIKSSNGAKIIFNQGAIVTGGSDQSHIVGPVEQRGSGNWLFPVGNGTIYLPVEIANVGDATATAVLQLHELALGETLSGKSEVTQLSSKRYWELNVLTGSLANSTIALPLRDESNLSGDPTLFAVAESANAFGDYASLGQSSFLGNPDSGSLTSEFAPAELFFTVVTLSDEKSIFIYNGVSPNDDGLNDYFKILNIESFPGNNVSIFNRWGDKVFEIDGYDNDQKTFKGENNLSGNGKIPSAIYFYKIVLGDDSKEFTGYLELK